MRACHHRSQLSTSWLFGRWPNDAGISTSPTRTRTPSRTTTHPSMRQCTIFLGGQQRFAKVYIVACFCDASWLWKPIIKWAHVCPVIFRSLRKLAFIGSQTVSRCHTVLLARIGMNSAVCSAAYTFRQGQAPGSMLLLMPGADPAVQSIPQLPISTLLLLKFSKFVKPDC